MPRLRGRRPETWVDPRAFAVGKWNFLVTLLLGAGVMAAAACGTDEGPTPGDTAEAYVTNGVGSSRGPQHSHNDDIDCNDTYYECRDKWDYEWATEEFCRSQYCEGGPFYYGDGGTGKPPECTPRSCEDIFPFECGEFDDGCGETLNCECGDQFSCNQALRLCERSRWVLQAEDPAARHYTGAEHTTDDGRTVWSAYVTKHDEGTLTSGPSTVLPEGNYRVWFRLAIVSKLGDPNESVAVIEVNDSSNGSQTSLAKLKLRRRDFTAEKAWQSFRLDVSWPVSEGHYMVPKVHFLDKPYASIHHDYTVIDLR